jgi:hypothetical protein
LGLTATDVPHSTYTLNGYYGMRVYRLWELQKSDLLISEINKW